MHWKTKTYFISIIISDCHKLWQRRSTPRQITLLANGMFIQVQTIQIQSVYGMNLKRSAVDYNSCLLLVWNLLQVQQNRLLQHAMFLVDENQNTAGCRNPVISAYTWNIDPETGFYNFIQGK